RDRHLELSPGSRVDGRRAPELALQVPGDTDQPRQGRLVVAVAEPATVQPRLRKRLREHLRRDVLSRQLLSEIRENGGRMAVIDLDERVGARRIPKQL